MERITQEQSSRLPSVGALGNHTWNLNGLKQCCPFTLTTGIHEGKAYATTRAVPNVGKVPKGRELGEMIEEALPEHIKKHSHFADTEVQAAYELVMKQYKEGLYSTAFGFKIKLMLSGATSEKLNALRQML